MRACVRARASGAHPGGEGEGGEALGVEGGQAAPALLPGHEPVDDGLAAK